MRTSSPGRQVVDDHLSILMDQGDPLAVRAEVRCSPWNRAIVVQGDRAVVNVPDRQGKSGIMGGRQVAAAGAEAEDVDLAIAPGLEACDFNVVGDAADLDRSIPESQRIASHGGVE